MPGRGERESGARRVEQLDAERDERPAELMPHGAVAPPSRRRAARLHRRGAPGRHQPAACLGPAKSVLPGGVGEGEHGGGVDRHVTDRTTGCGQRPSATPDRLCVVADSGARLLQLLGLLQRRASWSGPELAERLGVDARTVRRDVERLRGLGYDVVAAPGTSGGYRLASGSGRALPPLLLDVDEAAAVAVVLGIAAGAAAPALEAGALGSTAKLEQLVPPSLRSRIAALRSSTVALVPPAEPVPGGQLVELALACESHLGATFAYTARLGAETQRRVEPHRLVATDRRWYLVAYDLDRADWRTFRVDRIGALRITGHRFVPRPLEDPARLVAAAITATGYRYRAVVRIDAPLEQVAPLVRPGVGMLDRRGAATELSLGVDDFDWLAGFLVGLGLSFEALEPPELRCHLGELATRLGAAHGVAQPATAVSAEARSPEHGAGTASPRGRRRRVPPAAGRR